MEVSYTTTLDDFVEFNIHALKRSPSARRRFVLISAILPLMLLGIAAMCFGVGRPDIAALEITGAVTMALIYPLGYRPYVRWAIRSYARDLGTRGLIGRITLILTEESLIYQTESVQTVVRWRDMSGVEAIRECVYIYTTGLTAVIVPRHGFERAEDYEAVRDFALKKTAELAP